MRWFIPLCFASLLLIAGCGTPSFLVTPVSSSSKLQEVQVQEGKGWAPARIAIIEIEGMLANVRTGGFLQPQENKLSLFAQEMEHAARDPAVKAVVLRINSPGGTVTCSDTMYQIVKEFRAKTRKPVVASAQEVCASGGYYIACASDTIVAQPTSVVGSVGVLFNTFDISGGLAKLGIHAEAIKSAPLKDMGSPFRPLDPQARAVMQGMIDEYYSRFLNVVQSNRKIPDADKLKLATDGRVFSGEQALALGLVDRLGRLDQALDLAREMASAPGAKAIMYKRPYGYSGSIYADTATPTPRAGVVTFELPESALFLPRGFYYLWEP